MSKKKIAIKDRPPPPGLKSKAEIQKWESMHKEVTQINNHIDKVISKSFKKHEQKEFSWLPRESTRTSIFQPYADQELKNAHTEITFTSSWGSVEVHGPALNIHDEGVFLSLLSLVKKKESPVIKINFSEICRLLGITIQGRNFARIKKSILKLSRVSFTLELKDGTWSVEHILQRAKGSNDHSIIEIDPWFFSRFLTGQITLIDLKFRKLLTGDVTKALYRFVASHDGTLQFNTSTLILALNLNPDIPLRKNRDALKRAFSQLQSKKFLSFEYKQDLFFNIRKIKK